MFTRTPSGLSNIHLFHKVDYVVYVEGGISATNTTKHPRQKNQPMLDVAYWSRIFRTFKPEKKYKFIPIGGKTELQKTAEIVTKNRISTILVCMDRDLDDLRNKLYTNKNILYTRGYSWENDAYQIWAIEEAIYAASPCDAADQEVVEPLLRFHEHFIASTQIGVAFEITEANDYLSFFDRESLGRYITTDHSGAPCFCQAEIDKRLSELETAHDLTRVRSIHPTDVFLRCVGHLVAKYFQAIIRFLSKKLANIRTIENEIVDMLVIKSFFEGLVLGKDNDIKQYYSDYLVVLP